MAEKKITGDETVTIFVPRIPGGPEMMFVALNGKAYNIPRGTATEVPKDVANIFYMSVQAEENAWKQSEEFQRDMLTVQGAP